MGTWQIVYAINRHYRDRDNYSAIDNGSPEIIIGTSYDESVANLIQKLKNDKDLASIIDGEAQEKHNGNDSYSLNIISVNEILTAGDAYDVINHKLFKSLIDARKQEIINEKIATEKLKARQIRNKDLRELARLKKKYGND